MTLSDYVTTCPECGTVFDLLSSEGADQYYYGHDCEAIEEEDHDYS